MVRHGRRWVAAVRDGQGFDPPHQLKGLAGRREATAVGVTDVREAVGREAVHPVVAPRVAAKRVVKVSRGAVAAEVCVLPADEAGLRTAAGGRIGGRDRAEAFVHRAAGDAGATALITAGAVVPSDPSAARAEHPPRGVRRPGAQADAPPRGGPRMAVTRPADTRCRPKHVPAADLPTLGPEHGHPTHGQESHHGF